MSPRCLESVGVVAVGTIVLMLVTASASGQTQKPPANSSPTAPSAPAAQALAKAKETSKNKN